MHPLSQVFTVTSSGLNGPSQVSIVTAYLYFKSISNTNGVDIQIRRVANNIPTNSIIKNSKKTLLLTDKYANGSLNIVSSSDASKYTTFTFDKAVKLKTNKQYALCVLPHAHDPTYQCWGGQIEDIDISSKVPIQFNTSVGPLFFPSNDLRPTQSTKQAIKFLLEKNVASNPRQHNDMFNYNEEHFSVGEFSAPFVTAEYCYMSNSTLNIASVSIVSNVGAFDNGEAFYQSNGSVNVSSGFIFSANSGTMLLDQIKGSVTSSYQLKGITSSANAVLGIVNTQIICSNTSNNITLPFTGNTTASMFYANQTIYLTANDVSQSEIFIVTSVSVDNKTLTLSYPPEFSDSKCQAGIIRGDLMQLKMSWSGYDSIKYNNYNVSCHDSTADTSINPNHHFHTSEGQFIFGCTSRSRCRSYGTLDFDYHCIVPQIRFDTAFENIHKLYWGGYKRERRWTSTYPDSWRFDRDEDRRNKFWGFGSWSWFTDYDDNYKRLGGLIGDKDQVDYDGFYDIDPPWDFPNEEENEFRDHRRAWKSRSHEWRDDGGKRSVWCRHRCSITNNQVVPNIDPEASYITVTMNDLFSDEETFGYQLTYSNNTGIFLSGDIVTQTQGANTVTGNIYRMDQNYIYINICSGKFLPGYTVFKSNTSTVNSYALTVEEINEKFSANVFPNQSRYISKSIILTQGQSAEDIQFFSTVYRPANTNWKVYTKIINNQDPDNFSDRIWTRLIESNNTSSLFSSGTNLNDFIECQFGFPVSNLIFSNLDSAGCQSGNLQVAVPSSASFSSKGFIYLTDSSSGVFNVRQIDSVTNNTILTLVNAPTFSNTTNVNIGVINGLEDQTGAFLYDKNFNIVRYTRTDDSFFDSYGQFAIKLVPISDSPIIPIRIKNYRTIAVS